MSDVLGGCLCGAVRYEVRQIARVHYCHCGMCRRATGSAFAVLAWVPADDVTLTRGTPTWSRSTGTNWSHACSGSLIRQSIPARQQARHDVLEVFEAMVRDVLSGSAPPITWIGDEAMLAFPNPEAGIRALGQLLQVCRAEPRIPVTRSGVNHGPVIRRAGDIFGSTVNIAARIAALAAPGQLLAPNPLPTLHSPTVWLAVTSDRSHYVR